MGFWRCLSVHEIQHQHKHQHMHRVKGIAGILEWFAVAALPPAIQPDGYQRQQRKPLLAKFKLHAEQPDGVHQPAQKLHIDPVQGQHLSQQAPPFPAPEEVEGEHRQHTGTVVIRHAQRPQQRPCCHHCGTHRQ